MFPDLIVKPRMELNRIIDTDTEKNRQGSHRRHRQRYLEQTHNTKRHQKTGHHRNDGQKCVAGVMEQQNKSGDHQKKRRAEKSSDITAKTCPHILVQRRSPRKGQGNSRRGICQRQQICKRIQKDLLIFIRHADGRIDFYQKKLVVGHALCKNTLRNFGEQLIQHRLILRNNAAAVRKNQIINTLHILNTVLLPENLLKCGDALHHVHIADVAGLHHQHNGVCLEVVAVVLINIGGVIGFVRRLNGGVHGNAGRTIDADEDHDDEDTADYKRILRNKLVDLFKR